MTAIPPRVKIGKNLNPVLGSFLVNKMSLNILTTLAIFVLVKDSFWKIYVVGPKFQFMLIQILRGMTFRPVVVFGLGYDLICSFKFTLERCALVFRSLPKTQEIYKYNGISVGFQSNFICRQQGT